jgi:hypothetical protein
MLTLADYVQTLTLVCSVLFWHYYISFNNYVDVVWRCVFKSGPPSYSLFTEHVICI